MMSPRRFDHGGVFGNVLGDVKLLLKNKTGCTMMMLELFSGSGRMAQAFQKKGWNTLTVDLFQTSDLQVDILTLKKETIIESLGGEPDFIWASPPCTAFSVASIGHHWGGGWRIYEAKTEEARKGIALAIKTREIIAWFPKAIFCIENPRGVLRKLDVFKDMRRETITFCQYGERRMKPTDIWTNINEWQPRPMCKNNSACHESAPRGSRTGTQGLKHAKERGQLPIMLCEEVCHAAERHYEL
jgi:hypothetical protein